MTDKKITQLTAAATLDGTELVELVQAGANVKATAQDIADLVSASGGQNPTLVIETLLDGSTNSDGTDMTSWDTASVKNVSADAHWDNAQHGIVFDAPGIYRITIRARFQLTSGLFPNDNVYLFGIKAQSVKIAQIIREETGGGGGSNFSGETIFCGEGYVDAAAADLAVVAVYAKSYNTPNSQYTPYILVLCQRVSS